MPSRQLPQSRGGKCLPTRLTSGSCHLPSSPALVLAGTGAVSFILPDNDIIFLAGSFGWLSFLMLREFSISLSPPPSADDNDGVRDSSDRDPILSGLRTSERGLRAWLQTRVAASPLWETRDDRDGEGLFPLRRANKMKQFHA